ncbi:hypothetical protein FKM82_014011 [Ascaphus truei]
MDHVMWECSLLQTLLKHQLGVPSCKFSAGGLYKKEKKGVRFHYSSITHNLTMKMLIAVSVSCLALWSIVGVTSLQCHTCDKVSNNTQCNLLPVATCDASTIYCLTKGEELFGKLDITKRCANPGDCDKDNFNVWLASKKTVCCAGDLCNSPSPKSGQNVLQSNTILATSAILALIAFKNIL